tara:strand:+ start:3466 stop:3684 length:219 start_codon:yes stop_codon:yes gene_type:complete
MINVEGNSDLKRDPKSNAIINTNSNDYERYMKHRDVKRRENTKVSNMEEDLANMKNEISEIKSLLREIVNGN